MAPASCKYHHVTLNDDTIIYSSVVTTTSGCIFGSAYSGSKNESADRCGQRVGEELVKVLSGEACVDDYMQDQVRKDRIIINLCVHTHTIN